jgi:hypothetical protein
LAGVTTPWRFDVGSPPRNTRRVTLVPPQVDFSAVAFGIGRRSGETTASPLAFAPRAFRRFLPG